MNTGGVIKGGLLAGLVINVGEFVLNGVILAAQWEAAAAAIGMQDSPIVMAYWVVGAFVVGIVGVWLYAAVRPRLGAGPMTAVKVGLVVWLLGWVWLMTPLSMSGVFPAGLTAISLLWGLVEVPLAIAAGAWLYKEDDVGAASTVQPPSPHAA